MIKVSIVIPSFNRKESLSKLLSAIENQVKNINNYTFSIITVIDGSTDGTIEMIKKNHDDIKIVNGDGNWWFTKSLNEGCIYAIKSINTDLLITLNDDVELSPNYFKHILADYFLLGNDLILGSLSIDSNKKERITFSGIKNYNKCTGTNIPYFKYGTIYNKSMHQGVEKSILMPTRGLLFSKNVFLTLNGFDAIFPQYSSDNDFVLRAKRRFKTYISYNAIIYEKTELTGSGSPKLNKSYSNYIKQIFFNKYSPNFYKNSIIMIWRHRPKILFLYYYLISLSLMFYVYFKYKK